ncbi:dimethylsulfonioproprionate lyase family protein [Candidatus Pelagibacter sp.]|nr:dimethylsulfonioproprionate lyase family protein [Candidatus Pelagibacter sp.]
MSNIENIFENTKDEVEKLWYNNSILSNFVKFPKNLSLINFSRNKIPVTEKLFNWNSNLESNLKELHILISSISPYVNWEQGYEENDVGKDFLNKYGFFELIGPSGHFKTTEMALYVNYLCKNAYYPWHNHDAEELYFIVSGEAKFESKNQNTEILSSTNTRLHKSFESHAITTNQKPVLSFVIWKNKFEDVSKLTKD